MKQKLVLTKEEIYKRVESILVRILHLDKNEILPESQFFIDLGAHEDNIGLIWIESEKKFFDINLRMNDEDYENIETVQQLVNFIFSAQRPSTKEKVNIRVKNLVTRALGVDEREVTPEASFTNDLGADSLDVAEMLMNAEGWFEDVNLKISALDHEKIKTVQDLTNYVVDFCLKPMEKKPEPTKV